MDTNRKKELMEAYKNRRPEMGVVSVRCLATGESFLGTSSDTRATMNGIRVKLNGGLYPNRRLQELWKLHGPEEFEISVLRTLDYEDPGEDHTEELELLRELCLEDVPGAAKLWK